MSRTVHTRHVLDTVRVLSYTITATDDSGAEAAVDLTGRTVTFRLVNAVGEDVVAESATGVTVTDAANGEVEYDFSTASVAEYGVLYGYFNASSGGESDNYPEVQKELKIILHRD
jgi:hypothetical protein